MTAAIQKNVGINRISRAAMGKILGGENQQCAKMHSQHYLRLDVICIGTSGCTLCNPSHHDHNGVARRTSGNQRNELKRELIWELVGMVSHGSGQGRIAAAADSRLG